MKAEQIMLQWSLKQTEIEIDDKIKLKTSRKCKNRSR